MNNCWPRSRYFTETALAEHYAITMPPIISTENSRREPPVNARIHLMNEYYAATNGHARRYAECRRLMNIGDRMYHHFGITIRSREKCYASKWSLLLIRSRMAEYRPLTHHHEYAGHETRITTRQRQQARAA